MQTPIVLQIAFSQYDFVDLAALLMLETMCTEH
jgi:hypothetical protein